MLHLYPQITLLFAPVRLVRATWMRHGGGGSCRYRKGEDMSIAQALVTALLSGLFSGAIIFALNERREREKLLLEKAELAVEAYGDWVDTITHWPVMHFEFFGADRSSGRNAANAEWKRAHAQFRRARMLIGIYLPKHVSVLQDVHSSLENYGKQIPHWMSASLKGDPTPDGMHELIDETCMRIIAAGRDGTTKLITAVSDQANSPFLVRWPPLLRLARQGEGAITKSN